MKDLVIKSVRETISESIVTPSDKVAAEKLLDLINSTYVSTVGSADTIDYIVRTIEESTSNTAMIGILTALDINLGLNGVDVNKLQEVYQNAYGVGLYNSQFFSQELTRQCYRNTVGDRLYLMIMIIRTNIKYALNALLTQGGTNE